MNHTTNYQLSQWVKSDQVKMEDFNADNAKLDAALASHAAVLAGKGNCRVEACTYTGTGLGSTRQFTFSKRPDFVLIFGCNCIYLMPGRAENGIFIGKYEGLNNYTIMSNKFTWSGVTATLSSSTPQIRMDVKGGVYHAIAWIPVS